MHEQKGRKKLAHGWFSKWCGGVNRMAAEQG